MLQQQPTSDEWKAQGTDDENVDVAVADKRRASKKWESWSTDAVGAEGIESDSRRDVREERGKEGQKHTWKS